jgi:hypothetical protein
MVRNSATSTKIELPSQDRRKYEATVNSFSCTLMLLLVRLQKDFQQRRQMCNGLRTCEIHVDVFDSSASINFLFLLINFQCQWSCLANEGFPEAHMFVDSSFKIIRPVTRKSVKSTRRWNSGKLHPSFYYSHASRYREMAERNSDKLCIRCSRYVLTNPLPSNGRFFSLHDLIRDHSETQRKVTS